MERPPQTISQIFVSAGEAVKKQGVVSSWLSSFKPQAEKNADFIETLCERVSYLPSVYAAIQTVPELGHVPIKASQPIGGVIGQYYDKIHGIKICIKDTRSAWLDTQTATLPHELRHGYQDAVGCLSRRQPDSDVADHIFYNRFIEADATVFSLTALYEHGLESGDFKPLATLRIDHPEAVDAYCASVAEDDEAHLSGKAANAAFKAYFTNDDKGHLKAYDLAVCEAFFRAAEGQPDQKHPPGIDRKVLLESLSPLACMPYMNDLGNVKQRPDYRPHETDYDVVMAHVSSDVKDYIRRAKNDPAFKPA